MKQNQIFIWEINFLWEICCLSVNCVKKSRYKKAPVTIKFSNLLQDLSNILCTSVTSLLLLELITGCCITRMNSHLTAQAVGFICPRPLTDQRHLILLSCDVWHCSIPKWTFFANISQHFLETATTPFCNKLILNRGFFGVKNICAYTASCIYSGTNVTLSMKCLTWLYHYLDKLLHLEKTSIWHLF